MTETKKEQFSIDKHVLVAILTYLSEKPFKETSGLIQAIQNNAKLIGGEAAPVVSIADEQVAQ